MQMGPPPGTHKWRSMNKASTTSGSAAIDVDASSSLLNLHWLVITHTNHANGNWAKYCTGEGWCNYARNVAEQRVKEKGNVAGPVADLIHHTDAHGQ